VSSMFTAIIGTRAVINLIYGKKRLKTLNILPIWKSGI